MRDSYGGTWDKPSGAGRGCWGLWDVGESPSVGGQPGSCHQCVCGSWLGPRASGGFLFRRLTRLGWFFLKTLPALSA